ncbi:unnamed protein product [Aureobasidium mustum]|uniref:Uncharacterized protein n=1 Tax=Aureobasidium mustum TaxID=2773714 RepID=A0A9N8JXY8_9PEZI|nr:unnamed protein product [Aureobasidium mustum]
MSSRPESLPTELFERICETVLKDQKRLNQNATPMLNLSLTSKKCRSRVTRYIFHELVFQGDAQPLAGRLEDCVLTLKRLDVLDLVQGIATRLCVIDNPKGYSNFSARFQT